MRWLPPEEISSNIFLVPMVMEKVTQNIESCHFLDELIKQIFLDFPRSMTLQGLLSDKVYAT